MYIFSDMCQYPFMIQTDAQRKDCMRIYTDMKDSMVASLPKAVHMEIACSPTGDPNSS